MEVILRENIIGLGKIGDVVKVTEGYAYNFLVPQQKAFQATETNRKRLERERQVLEAKALEQKGTAEGLAARLTDVTLEIAKQASEEGKLYGSVTSTDIEAALAEKQIPIDRKMVQFADAIKEVGEYTVSLRLHNEVTVDIPVTVIAS